MSSRSRVLGDVVLQADARRLEGLPMAVDGRAHVNAQGQGFALARPLVGFQSR
jgi:hypothetical protein